MNVEIGHAAARAAEEMIKRSEDKTFHEVRSYRRYTIYRWMSATF